MSITVKKLEKQLPTEANFSTFWPVDWSRLALNWCEAP